MSYTRPIRTKDASCKENPRVFMDISVDDEPAVRLHIELFANVVPRTAENFRALCTGEKKDLKTGKRLHYKGSVFHFIRKGLLAQGGDLSEDRKARGEASIYGGFFRDENFKLRHTEPGILSVANIGPNTCGSMFYITLRNHPFLDGAHVVFGKVIKGIGALYNIDEVGTPGGTPIGVARIIDCGQLNEEGGKKRKGSSDVQELGDIDESKKQRKCSSSEIKDCESDQEQAKRKNLWK